MTSLNFPALVAKKGELDAARKALRDVFAEGQTAQGLDLSQIKSISGDKLTWIREQNDRIEKLNKEVGDLTEAAKIAEQSGTKAMHGDGAPHRGNLKALLSDSGVLKSRGKQVTLNYDITPSLKADFRRPEGWEPEVTRSGLVLLSALRPEQHVVNFVPSLAINQTAYKYMEETVFGTAQDGDAAETAEGQSFHETKLELVEKSQIVEKITVWIPVTDEQLEDVDAAEAYVQSRLVTMVHLRLDSQILHGDGSTPNLRGTLDVIDNAGGKVRPVGGDSLLDALYKLNVDIQETTFANPNVVFLRPSVWSSVQLAKTADGQYIWGHPSATGPMTAWGVPVVPTTVAPANRVITGDYANYSLLGVKRGIDVQVTNAHSDYFVKGKQAVRADMRAVMVHLRPAAFGTVDL